MNWTELLQAVRDRSGAPADETRAVLEAFVTISSEALEGGDEVVIPGLLKMSRRWQPPRTVRSVHNRRKVRLDGRWVPRIRPSRRLKQRLVEQTPQQWRDPEQQRAWRLAETLVDDLDLYHPDRAPAGLTPETPCDDVETACAEAFGAAWSRARRTFESKVAAHVRDGTSHLARVAKRRWATHP